MTEVTHQPGARRRSVSTGENVRPCSPSEKHSPLCGRCCSCSVSCLPARCAFLGRRSQSKPLDRVVLCYASKRNAVRLQPGGPARLRHLSGWLPAAGCGDETKASFWPGTEMREEKEQKKRARLATLVMIIPARSSRLEAGAGAVQCSAVTGGKKIETTCWLLQCWRAAGLLILVGAKTGKNSWYAIRFYTHSLCATEWHIGIFFCVYDMWGQWHTRNEYIFQWHTWNWPQKQPPEP
jgi:hypothetical protein